jgi:YHS domain-containing protein
MAMDPVCGMKIDDKKPKFQTELDGTNYVFCSQECKDKFEESPEEYVESAA